MKASAKMSEKRVVMGPRQLTSWYADIQTVDTARTADATSKDFV